MHTTAFHPILSRFLLTVGSLWLANSCSDDFAPRTVLSEYRVLGIQTSPPEVTLNGLTQVRVHDFIPEGLAGQYRWSLCPHTLGDGVAYQCSPGSRELQLGTEPSFELDLSADGIHLAALLEQQPERLYADGTPQNLERGIDVLLRLKSGLEGADLDCQQCDPTESVKRLTVRRSPEPPNSNPQLGPLQIEGELRTGQEVRLRVQANEPELFIEPRNGEANTEEFLFTWYTTAGETVPGLTFGQVQETTWELPQQAGPVLLAVAVRDGRGGLAVQRRTVEVLP